MSRPSKTTVPAPEVQEFRRLLTAAFATVDPATGKKIGNAKWGVYAFYDYEGEPIYVGQTKEKISTRVRRHLTNQRTDAAAMRVLDIFEVAEMVLYPLWHLEKTSAADKNAKIELNSYERSAYLAAVEASRYKAILNEIIPPLAPVVELPTGFRFSLISPETRALRGHADTRIARRAETIGRLAAVIHERGEVSDGLRRVLVIQAIRLAHIAATRLAVVEGRQAPEASAIDTLSLIGSVLSEDPIGLDPDAD